MVHADASAEADLHRHNSLGIKDAPQRAQRGYGPFPAYEREQSLLCLVEYGGCLEFSELRQPGFVAKAESVGVSVLHCQANGILPYTQGILLPEMLK
jgi:hypothetical protein